MIIVFRPEAEETLNEVAEFIDIINLQGAGDIWADKLVSYIQSFALPNVIYALCNNEDFAETGYSCINFNDWVIAFKIESEILTEYKIIRGNILQ